MVTYTVASVPVRPAVRAIIDLLNQHPEEWRFEGHEGRHSGGAVVKCVADYVYMTELHLPGLSGVVREDRHTTGLRGSREQRALYAALRGAQDHRAGETVTAYVARAAGARGDRRRQLVEDARRADFEADSLGIAARRALARAADARRLERFTSGLNR